MVVGLCFNQIPLFQHPPPIYSAQRVRGILAILVRLLGQLLNKIGWSWGREYEENQFLNDGFQKLLIALDELIVNVFRNIKLSRAPQCQ